MRKIINSFEFLDEMARVGYVNKNLNPKEKSNIQIVIYTDDGGKIPHFHVKVQGSSDACIRFKSAEYFCHGKHDGVVSTVTAKQIDSLLRMKYKNTEMTYWQYAVNLWNDNNSDEEIPEDLVQPDYTKLNK